MDKITTTIKREWLCEIAAGRKRVEYREAKPYWTRRLSAVRVSFQLRLINGMNPNAPEVTVIIRRVRKNRRSRQYELHLGKVVDICHWDVRLERPITAGQRSVLPLRGPRIRRPMTPQVLRTRIGRLPALPPITAALERALSRQGTEGSKRAWYSSQREHWLGWLGEYSGPGAYGRRDWRRTAEYVYNHIVCPPMVLWLCEASGIPRHRVSQAKRAALSAKQSFAAQAAAVRRVIPWAQVEEKLIGRVGSASS